MDGKLSGKVALVTGGTIGVRGDISRLDDLDRLFATIREKAGRLDVLFANAGLGAFAPLGQVSEEHFDKIFGVNVKGTVVTPAYRNELGLSDEQIAEMEAQAAALAPLGRAGTPDEIAKVAVFLASDDASYVNGAELFVDGGWVQV